MMRSITITGESRVKRGDLPLEVHAIDGMEECGHHGEAVHSKEDRFIIIVRLSAILTLTYNALSSLMTILLRPTPLLTLC